MRAQDLPLATCVGSVTGGVSCWTWDRSVLSGIWAMLGGRKQYANWPQNAS